jgi:hypothetical protein
MEWTMERIQALAAERGLTRLTPEHLARWLELARSQRDTTALRDAVACKTDAPSYGPGV